MKEIIYTKEIMSKGVALTHHNDRNIPTLLKIDNVIETNFIELKTTDSLRHVVNLF